MANGFSVRAGAVAEGGSRMKALGSEAQNVASAACGALEEMTSAAGHPGLAQALAGMGSTSAVMFAIARAAFERSATAHEQAAQGYRDAENKNLQAVSRIGERGAQ